MSPEQKTPEQFEPITDQTLEWLAFAGNDERKLLVILALSDAAEPLGQTALSRKIDELAGQSVVPELKQLRQFCEKTLADVGAVDSTPIEVHKSNGGIVPGTGFLLNPDHRDFAVSFAGALSKWSYSHPDLSLALLGQTNTTSDDQNSRAPVRRFWALYELATHPDDTKSPAIIAISRSQELDASTGDKLVERLEQKGVLRKDTSRREHSREFTIDNPDMPEEGGWTRDRLSDSTRLLYDGFQAAFRVKSTWHVDEFMAFLSDRFDVRLEQLKHVRARLGDAFKPNSKYLAQSISTTEPRFAAGSRVELKHEHATAIRELVGIIDAFCVGDPEILRKGAADAEEIISNPEAVADLYDKALREVAKRVDDKEFTDTLNALIIRLGGTATRENLRAAYEAETGRSLASRTFSNRLGLLIADGKIDFTVQPRRTDAEPVRVYRVAGLSPDQEVQRTAK